MKTYSFDLFDTCLVRACGAPHTVFDLLAYRILGENSSESERADFALIRVEGERRSRISAQEEEVTLDEIYECCDFCGLTPISVSEICEAEKEIECEQLLPVYAVRKHIEELHQRGVAVYYISDMYLPQDFLRQILVKHGFWEEGDKLYVSSAYRKTKQTGNLYRHIAKENELDFKQWHHWGDNEYSDYRMPRRLGITATLVNHKYSVYERFLLKQDYFSGFFVNQHMSSISKAVRFSFPDTPQYAFAADLIAPVYVPFVYHVLKDAVFRGIQRLFFLARDGYILYCIAKEFQKEFQNLEMRYLYVSRSSLYLPGLPSITSECLCSFNVTKESKLDFLANYVTPEVLSEIKAHTQKDTIVEAFADPDVLDIVSRYHDEQRNLILQYFIQEGLADSSCKTAVVDVRGTRSCQEAINTILSQGGFSMAMGYYLEVMYKRRSVREAGPYSALYYVERMNVNMSLGYITDLYNVLEQYFSASPHERTISYYESNGRVEPVFEFSKIDTHSKSVVLCNEPIVILFARLFVNNRLNLYLPEVLMLSTRLLSYFSQRPIYNYLKAIDLMEVNSNRGKYMPIVKRLSLWDLKPGCVNWFRGSVYFSIRTTLGYRYINWLFQKGFLVYKRILNRR